MVAVVFVVSAVMVWRGYRQEADSAKQFKALEALIVKEPEPQTEQEQETPLTAAEKYAAVAAQNKDFVGWLTIDGTAINYPVVQTPKQPEYYLRRGYDGKYSYYGVPFADADCVVPGGDNIVIYGHNMNNGTMFADLSHYVDEEYFEEHPTVQFDTLEGYGTYEILSVFKTTASAEEEFAYFRFNQATDATEFEQYVTECKKRSLYETGIFAEYGDELITLSTCEYSVKNGRIVVVAKKIKD